MFIRFVVTERDPDSNHPMGVFTALYSLERKGELEPYEVAWFRDIETWFNRNLRRPDQLASSKRPNAPNRAISWFRDSATEHVSRMRELVILLQHKDIHVDELRTETPGYIVYEDEAQVATIPFHN